MTRNDAYQILTKYLKNKNLIKHCLACEAAMKGIYRHLYKDTTEPESEQTWGITGLLHDADYELSMQDLSKHGLLLFEHEKNIPNDIAYAIKAHNYEGTGVLPQSKMDWAIACCDQLTGLITAAALIRPEKQLAPLTKETILKRMREKSFAKGAKREPILACEEKLGIPLEHFIDIVLKAMQDIHNDLEL